MGGQRKGDTQMQLLSDTVTSSSNIFFCSATLPCVTVISFLLIQCTTGTGNNFLGYAFLQQPTQHVAEEKERDVEAGTETDSEWDRLVATAQLPKGFALFRPFHTFIQ